MLTISINSARFFCYHGLYAEERKVGGEFEVNLSVQYLSSQEIVLEIGNTVNYVDLFEITKKRMVVATPLLETLVMQIAEDIHQKFSEIKKINISIAKLQPPIPQFTGSTCVSFEREY